jgi:hypothetical protein
LQHACGKTRRLRQATSLSPDPSLKRVGKFEIKIIAVVLRFLLANAYRTRLSPASRGARQKKGLEITKPFDTIILVYISDLEQP